MNYILAVPAWNEEKNLPRMMESIIKQTVTPSLCVIVDDGSTDNTPRIINELEQNFSWIRHRTLPKNVPNRLQPWGPSMHFATVVNEGFKYAQELCSKSGITYDYLGKVDADVILPEDYFERLLKEFQKDPRLGIASGEMYQATVKDNIVAIGHPNQHIRGFPDSPTDAARLYRKACFDDIGGFPLMHYSPDGIALAKARLHGWRTQRFKEIRIFSIRVGARGNTWRKYQSEGYAHYCMDHGPILNLLKVSTALFERPHWGVFAWLYGYFLAFLHREAKIADPELRYYYRHQRLREITKIVVRKLRAPFRWRQEGKL